MRTVASPKVGVTSADVVSVIVTVTLLALSGVSEDGSVSPSATVNVSFSASESADVVIRPVPVVESAAIVMLASAPMSSASAVPRVTASGIVTLPSSAPESVAVTVTGEPSFTGFGEADRLTVAA